MDVFLGLIFPFAGTFAPVYSAQCWGQQLPVSQYQTLYSIVVNLYGGNSTNFNLPDLRGRVMVGTGTSPYLNNITLNPGNSGGTASTQLTALNLPQHTHGATFTPGGGGGSSTINATVSIPVGTATTGTNVPAAGANYLSGLEFSDGGAGGALTGPYINSNPGNTSYLQGSATGNVTVSGASGTVTVAAGGGVAVPAAFSNLQPYLAVTMFITTTGIYPMRD
ncbi:phage tail protein [Niveispirillum irakense]|uniref:phage tail protein n=1 Tax=Niveispirillum irakense TaxID=34011 RepID=UPI000A047F30|nr:tail fiber protein [Niveispirillum irakense]